jgi:hypothetical protein
MFCPLRDLFLDPQCMITYSPFVCKFSRGDLRLIPVIASIFRRILRKSRELCLYLITINPLWCFREPTNLSPSLNVAAVGVVGISTFYIIALAILRILCKKFALEDICMYSSY